MRDVEMFMRVFLLVIMFIIIGLIYSKIYPLEHTFEIRAKGVITPNIELVEKRGCIGCPLDTVYIYSFREKK